jgi:hypothetical protein
VQNVTHTIRGSKLTIEVDLSSTAQANARPSTTGKTMLIATTGGKVDLPPLNGHAVSFALNVMMKP